MQWQRLDLPLELTGGVPVDLQDQHTKFVVAPMGIELNSGYLLASSTSPGDTTVTLTAGHGAVAGNTIKLRQGIYYFCAGVLSVATNVLTIDTPLDHDFTTSAHVKIVNCNLNVNGSLVSPIEARVEPALGVRWDITRLQVILVGTGAMDFTLFGDQTELTNGLVFGKVNGGAESQNIANAKSNADLIRMATDHGYHEKVGGGAFGLVLNYQFGGQGGVGVVLRLDSAQNEAVRLLVQDDLTGLTEVRFVCIGHVIQD